MFPQKNIARKGLIMERYTQRKIHTHIGIVPQQCAYSATMMHMLGGDNRERKQNVVMRTNMLLLSSAYLT